MIFQGSSEFKVIDYWIVAIGDSFASGEGNPDKNLIFDKKVEWIDGLLYFISDLCFVLSKLIFKRFLKIETFTIAAFSPFWINTLLQKPKRGVVTELSKYEF